MMAKKPLQALVVTPSGDRALGDVVRDLKAAGFEVGQVMEAIGVVTGSAPSSDIAKLRKVRGVKDVSPDHAVDIGPPGAPVS
jgi:hypothetical protein